jgi:uncharacterized protein
MTFARRVTAAGLGVLAVYGAATAALCAEYAPIDCTRAADPAQRAVCQNYSLGQAEARMATLYAIVTSLVPMGQRSNLMDQQRQWLRQRDACGGDNTCLANIYARRIGELNAAMADIASRGPF